MQRAAARAAHLAEVWGGLLSLSLSLSLGDEAQGPVSLAEVERELDVVVDERAAELKAALKALDEAFLLLGQATIAQSAPEVFHTRLRSTSTSGMKLSPPPRPPSLPQVFHTRAVV